MIRVDFSELTDKVIDKIAIVNDERIYFLIYPSQEAYRLNHEQECCEDVRVEDICGDLRDIIGHPILLAEEVTYEEGVTPEECSVLNDGWSPFYQWTFYKLSTIKGSVTIRFHGQSNGYYAVGVNFTKSEGPREFSSIRKEVANSVSLF